jgi:hypothetical protein
VTATLPLPTDLRDCRLYRFWVEHPVTGEEVLGYIGETVRRPFDRMMEHVDVQPWIDTVTRWERDPRVFAGKGAVLEAEAQAIRAEKPLYNVRGNERNKDRIIPPDAIRQRRARDAARNKPRWVHPDDRTSEGVRQSTTIVPERRPSTTRKWSPVQVKAALWSSAWLLLTILGWGECARHGSWSTRTDAISGGVTAALVMVWGLWRKPDSVKLWKRRLRKIWRWFR